MKYWKKNQTPEQPQTPDAAREPLTASPVTAADPSPAIHVPVTRPATVAASALAPIHNALALGSPVVAAPQPISLSGPRHGTAAPFSPVPAFSIAAQMQQQMRQLQEQGQSVAGSPALAPVPDVALNSPAATAQEAPGFPTAPPVAPPSNMISMTLPNGMQINIAPDQIGLIPQLVSMLPQISMGLPGQPPAMQTIPQQSVSQPIFGLQQQLPLGIPVVPVAPVSSAGLGTMPMSPTIGMPPPAMPMSPQSAVSSGTPAPMFAQAAAAREQTPVAPGMETVQTKSEPVETTTAVPAAVPEPDGNSPTQAEKDLIAQFHTQRADLVKTSNRLASYNITPESYRLVCENLHKWFENTEAFLAVFATLSMRIFHQIAEVGKKPGFEAVRELGRKVLKKAILTGKDIIEDKPVDTGVEFDGIPWQLGFSLDIMVELEKSMKDGRSSASPGPGRSVREDSGSRRSAEPIERPRSATGMTETPTVDIKPQIPPENPAIVPTAVAAAPSREATAPVAPVAARVSTPASLPPGGSNSRSGSVLSPDSAAAPIAAAPYVAQRTENAASNAPAESKKSKPGPADGKARKTAKPIKGAESTSDVKPSKKTDTGKITPKKLARKLKKGAMEAVKFRGGSPVPPRAADIAAAGSPEPPDMGIYPVPLSLPAELDVWTVMTSRHATAAKMGCASLRFKLTPEAIDLVKTSGLGFMLWCRQMVRENARGTDDYERTRGTAKHEWHPGIVALVFNGKIVPIHKKVPATETESVKGRDRPADLTKFLIEGLNAIDIHYDESKLPAKTETTTPRFLVSLEPVQNRTLDESIALFDLKEFQIPEEEGRKRTLNLFDHSGGGDLEVLANNTFRIELRCPIGRSNIISTAALGTECGHIQIFDLRSCLEVNQRRPKAKEPTWECPVQLCKKRVDFAHLRKDLYMQGIFDQVREKLKDQYGLDQNGEIKVPPTVTTIELFKDLTWRIVGEDTSKKLEAVSLDDSADEAKQKAADYFLILDSDEERELQIKKEKALGGSEATRAKAVPQPIPVVKLEPREASIGPVSRSSGSSNNARLEVPEGRTESRSLGTGKEKDSSRKVVEDVEMEEAGPAVTEEELPSTDKKSLLEAYPLVAAQMLTRKEDIDPRVYDEAWSHHSNGRRPESVPLDPSQLTPHSGKCVVWKCLRDPTHQYAKPVGTRVANEIAGADPCKLCRREMGAKRAATPSSAQPSLLSTKRPALREGSPNDSDASVSSKRRRGVPLTETHPEIAALIVRDLDPKTKIAQVLRSSNQGKLWQNPGELSKGQKRLVAFRCAKNPDHVYTAVLQRRVNQPFDFCPKCLGDEGSSSSEEMETSSQKASSDESSTESSYMSTSEAEAETTKRGKKRKHQQEDHVRRTEPGPSDLAVKEEIAVKEENVVDRESANFIKSLPKPDPWTSTGAFFELRIPEAIAAQIEDLPVGPLTSVGLWRPLLPTGTSEADRARFQKRLSEGREHMPDKPSSGPALPPVCDIWDYFASFSGGVGSLGSLFEKIANRWPLPASGPVEVPKLCAVDPELLKEFIRMQPLSPEDMAKEEEALLEGNFAFGGRADRADLRSELEFLTDIFSCASEDLKKKILDGVPVEPVDWSQGQGA